MSLRKPKSGVPLVVLLLLVGAVFVMTGVQASTDQATAATTSSTYGSTTFTANYLFPEKNAVGVPVNTNIVAGFSQKADADTIDEISFTLKRNGVDEVSASVSYNATTNKATLNPTVDLEPSTTYVATLTSAIENLVGKPLKSAPVKWSFTTDTPPVMTSRTPATGAMGVPVDTTVTISFNKPMAAGTINAATFLVKKNGTETAVGATVAYNASTYKITLTPSQHLQDETIYQVVLTTAVKGENGLVVEGAPIIWSFTTGAVAPHVTTKAPANGASGVSVTESVTATFDQIMEAASVTPSSFILKKNGVGSPLAAAVTYSAGTLTATLDPSTSLENGTTYEASLLPGILGLNGEPLAATPIVWSFTTIAGTPVLTTKVPADGVMNVPVGQVVSATFNQDMNPATITAANFYLQKQGGAPLPAAVAYSAVTRTATIDPSADLEAGAIYQVTMTAGVYSAAGLSVAGAPVVWSFTTAEPTSAFSDVVAGVTPYSTAIAQLAAHGVITGFTDGTFRPNGLVTRQQFAKMIVLALQIPVTGAEVCPFTDVVTQIGTDPFYPSKYVAVCALNNITQGITPTTFAPYSDISHQQLITMLARAANLSDPPAAYAPSFTAAQFSPNEHYLNARKAAYAGLLDGLLGVGPSYSFFAGSTRGECAQLLYNLMVLMAG
jgi:hypothetical protein